MFGYRLVEGYKFAETSEKKALQIDTLHKIYELGSNFSCYYVIYCNLLKDKVVFVKGCGKFKSLEASRNINIFSEFVVRR